MLLGRACGTDGLPGLNAMQAVFSRLGPEGLSASIPPADLPSFLVLAAGVDGLRTSEAQIAAVVDALRRELARAHGEGPYTLLSIAHAARTLAHDRAAERVDDIERADDEDADTAVRAPSPDARPERFLPPR
jgi:hypothetical protein